MDKRSCPTEFGEWLRQRRKALDLTQSELADRIACSVYAVRKIEAGTRRPSKQLVHLLADALAIPESDRADFAASARRIGATPSTAAQPRVSADSPHAERRTSSAPRPHHSLPVYHSPLVGRTQDLGRLTDLLREPACRLVTLTGPGGIGKTRLATELAHRESGRFRDGAHFVSLASISSIALLVPTLADALGVTFQGRAEPRAELLHHLADRSMLLLLDNAEHLLDGVDLFAAILDSAPDIKLLVTSRERLNLQSEWTYLVGGLETPACGQSERPEEYSAIQLFSWQAQRTQTSFKLREAELEAVSRICRLVEGMPLAIEMAAAWVPLLNCNEIAGEIERSLDFLETSARDVPPRQRSLRAVFEHSWRLLAPPERRVLGRLSLFTGGFRREAAQTVAGASLHLLDLLSSKSLVRRSDRDRYDLHEIVRQYAHAFYSTDPEYEDARTAHSRYYLTLLHDRERAIKGAGQGEAIGDLKADLGNLRVAWQRAIDRHDWSVLGPSLRSLGWLCNAGVLYNEGVDLLEMVIRPLRGAPDLPVHRRVLGTALAQQGMLTFRQGEFARALALLEESLDLHRPLDDITLLPDALVLSGILLMLNGELTRARARQEEALRACRQACDRSMEAYALFNLGYLASLDGRYAEGSDRMKDGLAIWRELGDPSAIALGLNHISPSAIQLGRLDEAEAYLREAVALAESVGDRWSMGTSYRLLGAVALGRNKPDQACDHIRRSLQLFEGFIKGWDVAESLIFLERATRSLGDGRATQSILIDGFRHASAARSVPLMLDAMQEMAELHGACGRHDEALRLAGIVASHPLSGYETRQQARRLCTGATLQPEHACALEVWELENVWEETAHGWTENDDRGAWSFSSVPEPHST